MTTLRKLLGLNPNVVVDMFSRFLLGFVLALTLSGQTLYAQQSDADANKLAEVRFKADKGDAKAQWELGKAFSQGEFGLEKDQQEAVKWFRKAAEQNFASAQFNLGACYMFGNGVEKEQQEAVKWYLKAAEQNDVWSQFNLGTCYYNGNGVRQDVAEAVKWYRKAAEQNYVLAQDVMGDLYGSGIGMPQDLTEAVKWYRKAAEQNFAPAQRKVGEAYFKGIVVEKNMTEAYKWFLLAVTQGDEDAKARVRYLEKKLKKDQIAGVKKQVAEWTQQYKKVTNQKELP